MGRRSEQRIAISIPVFVRGKGSRGIPFAAATETYEISPYGASLKGLDDLVQKGMKIEIQRQDEKAWFRVEWVAEKRISSVGRFGVRCLEPGKYIWGVQPKEWEPDAYDPSAPTAKDSPRLDSQGSASQDWGGKDRRRFPRQSCVLEAQLVSGNSSVQLPVKITDLSLTGCYVETLSPMPPDSIVEMAIKKGGKRVHVSGKVRFSQNGMGMGIVFTAVRPEDFDNIRELAGVKPEPRSDAGRANANSYPATEQESAPVSPPTTADALEAMMRVLLRRGILTQAELSEELEKLKFVKELILD